MKLSSRKSANVTAARAAKAGLAPSGAQKVPVCRLFLMGRTGIEPVTLGSKVDVLLSWQLAPTGGSVLLS
jgi:hypothetical protein